MRPGWLSGFPRQVNVDHLIPAYGATACARPDPVNLTTIVHQSARRFYGSPFAGMAGHVFRSIKAKVNVPVHDDHPP
jgi:hypothetical protein